MNFQTSYQKGLFDSKFCQLIKTQNDLEIGRIDYIKDTHNGRLVIFLESDYLLDLEANAIIQGKSEAFN